MPKKRIFVIVGLFAFVILVGLGIWMRSKPQGKVYNIYNSTAGSSAKERSFGFGLQMASDSALESSSPKFAPQPASFSEAVGGEESGASAERMVIKNATLNMVVKDVASALSSIQAQVEASNGYVVSSRVDNPQEMAKGSITVRVPEDVFESLLGQFRSVGVKITSEYVSGKDVTEEYSDLSSQLRNYEKSEEQFLKIMERSGSIKDVLDVQREINNVRGQVERTKGKMKYLSENVSFSSITANLATEESSLPLVTPTNKWEPQVVLKRALRSLFQVFQELSYGIIWILIYSPLWIPVFLFAAWGVKRLVWKK